MGVPQGPPNALGNPPCVVTVGTVLPGDDDAQGTLYQNSGSDPIGIFDDYVINNRYEDDPHRYMLGITSPNGFNGNRAAFVQLASSTLLWIADWTACRTSSQPIIPKKESDDPGWVFLYAMPETSNVVFAGADGKTPLYRISGTYVYGQRSPSANVYDHVVYGRPPWIMDQLPNGRTVQPSTLEGNLINATINMRNR